MQFLSVKAGSIDLTNDDQDEFSSVSSIVTHGNYNFNNSAQLNDIALVFVSFGKVFSKECH